MSRTLLAAVIWSAFGLVCLISEYAHAGEFDTPLRTEQRIKPPSNIPPGLQRVMAEGAGRVANMTCADVSAFVAIYGARRAEAVARAAGASEAQIHEGKRCLKSSSR